MVEVTEARPYIVHAPGLAFFVEVEARSHSQARYFAFKEFRSQGGCATYWKLPHFSEFVTSCRLKPQQHKLPL